MIRRLAVISLAGVFLILPTSNTMASASSDQSADATVFSEGQFAGNGSTSCTLVEQVKCSVSASSTLCIEALLGTDVGVTCRFIVAGNNIFGTGDRDVCTAVGDASGTITSATGELVTHSGTITIAAGVVNYDGFAETLARTFVPIEATWAGVGCRNSSGLMKGSFTSIVSPEVLTVLV